MDVYNLLPAEIVSAENVSILQKRLQVKLIEVAKANVQDWREVYSPRLPIYAHPLRGGIFRGRELNILDDGGASTSTMCMRGWLSFGQ